MIMDNRTTTTLRLSFVLVAAALLTIRFGACSPDKDEGDGDGDGAEDPAQDETEDFQYDPDAADPAAEDLLEIEADPAVDRAEEDVPQEPGEDGELVPPACNFEDPRPPPPEWGIVWDPRLSGTGEDTLGGYDHDDGVTHDRTAQSRKAPVLKHFWLPGRTMREIRGGRARNPG